MYPGHMPLARQGQRWHEGRSGAAFAARMSFHQEV